MEIARREVVAAADVNGAVSALEELARTVQTLAWEACRGLEHAGEDGLLRLERIAGDRALPEETRMAAAESLHRRNPSRARPALEDLAREAKNRDVRQLAERYLEESSR